MLSHLIAYSAVRLFEHIRNLSDNRSVDAGRSVSEKTICRKAFCCNETL
jgi:hypothetical protein